VPLQLDDLAALDAPMLQASGLPLVLPLDSIEEDPEQPRREFDSNALEELAQTIRERGVRQPVSVRPHLQQAGRWVLNFGARRLRASRLAGRQDIPAFIDATADSYDQVIENEQRAALTPLELALFVQKRLALGDKQSEIARRLGKSRQWVTLATALIEAPDWLLEAYRSGRCRGLNELYEVRRLHGEHAQAVEAWVARQAVVSRDRLGQLREQLERVLPEPPASPAPATANAGRAAHGAQGDNSEQASDNAERRSPGRRAQGTDLRVHVHFDGQDYQLVVSVAPPAPGHVYVRPLAGGPRRTAPVRSVTLLGFVNG